jgi:putative tricarboxylic transport membrane protein
MDMFQTVLGQVLLSPALLGLIFLGMAIGVIVGMLPGLNATMAIALLLPLTYTMDPIPSISLLVAIFVGGMTGGCISAILLRIPGTPNSVATVLDGYAMAQSGRAGKALGLAIIASVFGTIFSGIILIIFAPTLARLALDFHTPEYVAAFFFALTAVVAVSSNSLLKGLIAALIGGLVATVGISSIDGLPRFDFGTPQLLGGLPLVPALVGLFAVSQIMRDALAPARPSSKVQSGLGWQAMLPGGKEVLAHTPNALRSASIGTAVGILPAIGGGPAGLIAYAQARNSSKTPERFGRGEPAGVVAAEAANNATVGGALITAMTLGIPGDTVTAMLIGALTIQGVQPGPLMFANSPGVVYAIYISVMVASVMMFVFMLGSTGLLVRLLDVPRPVLLPALFVIACVGIYSLNGRMFEIWVMLGFGLLGFLMEQFRYPLPPVILGFLLGPPFEANLRKMLGQYESLVPLFTRPISLTLIIAALVFLTLSLRSNRRMRPM